MVSVMWFRRDLRLEDNIALSQAFEKSEKLILLFQVNPEQFLEDSMNHAAFFTSVLHLKKEIEKQGMYLQILHGDIEESFQKLKKDVPNWTDVYFNQDEKGYGKQRDDLMRTFFKENDISVHSYMDHYLHGAHEVHNNSGDLYKVFTPYYNKWIELDKPTPMKVEIDQSKVMKKVLYADNEEKLEKMVEEAGLDINYKPGTQAAKEQLKLFIEERLDDYEIGRDYPDEDKTSRLSQHMRLGELSIRTLWAAVQAETSNESQQTFLKELCWRDFYHMIYVANPNQKEQPIKEQFSHIQWDNDEEQFEKWIQGKTGYPIVDAAMRQLSTLGWMHNRLRMITASFLTKDLLIDWRRGEKHFQKMLTDYDPCNNIGGWQWAASTGTDAVPYFRIFNPTTQSEKYDKSGDFIREFVPELKSVKNKYIHAPEKMSKEEQEACGVIIGENYPAPIVNHSTARKRAISIYEESKDIKQ
ncbi:deoxyribodipyrimidine photo-lyase [Marinilactibacillus sp. XAAS-LB27]|uniref:cryptochrome/photolyase family protein n=1 Tax=Marinilactibacillus sp. XAAS-LB27 TaxID=3114538 RepID=UPI002E190E12|nr:deoxyribodipyrimidine photo-lyase [Marinilactibacillus sp. XAAS-LB27]